MVSVKQRSNKKLNVKGKAQGLGNTQDGKQSRRPRLALPCRDGFGRTKE